MTATVLWMRHGTCDDGLRHPGAHARPDSPLTSLGLLEAEETVQHLCDDHWQPALVAATTLPRARQTAAIMATKLEARLAPPIAAWRAPHCVLGRTPAQYPPNYRAWRDRRCHDLDSALPGGESLHVFTQRATEAAATASDLATKHGSVLVVSHRLLIGAIAAIHTGHQEPVDVFSFARDFSLAPAALWAPDQGRHR